MRWRASYRAALLTAEGAGRRGTGGGVAPAVAACDLLEVTSAGKAASVTYSVSMTPRQVKIGDAAAFAGTTPRAVRHYHEIGLLPEPARGGDGRRRYGHDDMIRLLWIRNMADAGISLDDMRTAFGEARDGA